MLQETKKSNFNNHAQLCDKLDIYQAQAYFESMNLTSYAELRTETLKNLPNIIFR